MSLRNWLRRLFGPTAVASALLASTSAHAFTSIEGTAIGDQGFYWFTPAEVWIFAHRLGNIDNRMALQLGTPSATVLNVLDVQRAEGAGLVLELADDLNLGLWASTYVNPTNVVVNNAVNALDFWDDGAGADPDLGNFDPRDPTVASPRKIDLFASYWLADLGLETGLHLWFGSDHNSFTADDSLGPIDIDVDSNSPFGTEDEALSVKESTYSHSDLGIGLGAGYRAIEGLRADFGLDFNMLGVTWEPNGINNFADVGGTGLAFNARAHYDLAKSWTVGGFFRFATESLGVEPLRQRDGGDLPAADETSDANLPTPNNMGAAQPLPEAAYQGEATPVRGIKYEQGRGHVQLAGLVRYQPSSRVSVYGAAGFDHRSTSEKISVGSTWSVEETIATTALPFVNMGMSGHLFSWLELMFGATKRWQATTTDFEGFDSRIPDDSNAQGGGAPAQGSEDNTNANRRRFSESSSVGSAPTEVMVGTRLWYGPFQLVGHVNLPVILNGTYILSGQADPVWAWVSLVWDWDHDADVASGNGTLLYTPGAPAAPAPAPAAAPAQEQPGYRSPYDAPPAGGAQQDSGYQSPYGTPQDSGNP